LRHWVDGRIIWSNHPATGGFKLQGLTPKHGSRLRSNESCANRETGKGITPARKPLAIAIGGDYYTTRKFPSAPCPCIARCDACRFVIGGISNETTVSIQQKQGITRQRDWFEMMDTCVEKATKADW
jgi:hypothetical protein